MTLWQVIKKYFHYATTDKQNYFLKFFFFSISILTLRVGPIFYGKIVDAFTVNDFELASTLIVAFLFIRTFGGLIESLSLHFGKFAHNTMMIRLRNDYVKAIHSADYVFHTNKSSGKLISIEKRGSNAVRVTYLDINTEGLRVVIGFIIAFVSLWSIKPDFGVYLLGVTIVFSIINAFLVKINITRRILANKEEDKISGFIVDNMLGFETIKIFAKEAYEQSRLKKLNIIWNKTHNYYFNSFRFLEINQTASSSIAIGLILVLSYSALKNGSITLGEFITAFTFTVAVVEGLESLMQKMRDFGKTYADMENMFATMQTNPKITDKPNALSLKNVNGEVKFNNVNFTYELGQNALKNVSLNIESGQTVALVGKSGSGKTTLTKLLMRFYDIDSGSILIDGHDIKKLRIKSLRDIIGLVPQDPVLFNDSIAFNISYPKPNSSIDDIKKAAKLANLDSFIESLPNKYETIVGERGIKLSGGQKQRLAIARVILEDPDIVIFDEATSQLDSINEKKIQKAFNNLTKHKTTIVIAHRLSTTQNADNIFVFKEGEIIESGKHRMLLGKNGEYAKLWNTQHED